MMSTSPSIIQRAFDESLELRKKKGGGGGKLKKIIIDTYYKVQPYLQEELTLIQFFLKYTKRHVEEKGMWFDNQELLRIFAIHFGLKYEHYKHECFDWLISYTIGRFFYRKKERSRKHPKTVEGIETPASVLILDYFISLLRDLKIFASSNNESQEDSEEDYGILITFLPGFLEGRNFLFNIKPDILTSNVLNFLCSVVCDEKSNYFASLAIGQIQLTEECLFHLSFSGRKIIKLLSLRIISRSLLSHRKNPLYHLITKKLCDILFPPDTTGYPDYRVHDFDESLSICIERLDLTVDYVRKQFVPFLVQFVEYNINDSFSSNFRKAYVNLIIRYIEDGYISSTTSSLTFLKYFGKEGYTDIEDQIIETILVFFIQNRKVRTKRERVDEIVDVPIVQENQYVDEEEIQPPLKRRKLENGDEEEIFNDENQRQHQQTEDGETNRTNSIHPHDSAENTRSQILEYFDRDSIDVNNSNFIVFKRLCELIQNCDFSECQSLLRLFLYFPEREEEKEEEEQDGEDEEDEDVDGSLLEEEEKKNKERSAVVEKEEMCKILRESRCLEIVLRKFVSMIIEDEELLESVRVWDCLEKLLLVPEYFKRIETKNSSGVCDHLCSKFSSFFDRITKEVYNMEVLLGVRVGRRVEEEEEEEEEEENNKYRNFSEARSIIVLNRKREILERMMACFGQTRSSLSPALISHFYQASLSTKSYCFGLDCDVYSRLPEIFVDVQLPNNGGVLDQARLNEQLVLRLVGMLKIFVVKEIANSTLAAIVTSLVAYLKRVGSEFVSQNRKRFNFINRFTGDKDYFDLTVRLIPLVEHVMIPCLPFEKCLDILPKLIACNNNLRFKEKFISVVFPAIVEREERNIRFSNNASSMVDEEEEEKESLPNKVYQDLFEKVFRVCEKSWNDFHRQKIRNPNSKKGGGGGGGVGGVNIMRISREEKKAILRKSEEKRMKMNYFCRTIAYVGRKFVRKAYSDMIQNERELMEQNMRSKKEFRVFGEKFFRSGEEEQQQKQERTVQQKEILRHQKEKENRFYNTSYADCVRTIVESLIRFSSIGRNVDLLSVIEVSLKSIRHEIYYVKKYSREQINMMMRVLYPPRIKIGLILRQNIRGDKSVYRSMSMLTKMMFTETNIDSFIAKILPSVIIPHVVYHNVKQDLLTTKNMVNAIKIKIRKFRVKSTYEYVENEVQQQLQQQQQQFGKETIPDDTRTTTNNKMDSFDDDVWSLMESLRSGEKREVRSFEKYIELVFPTIVQKILGMMADGLKSQRYEIEPQRMGDIITYEPQGREVLDFFVNIVMKNFTNVTGLDDMFFKGLFCRNVNQFIYYLHRKKKGRGIMRVVLWLRDRFNGLQIKNNKRNDPLFFLSQKIEYFEAQFRKDFLKYAVFYNYINYHDVKSSSSSNENININNNNHNNKRRRSITNNKKKKGKEEEDDDEGEENGICTCRKLIDCFENFHSFLDNLREESFFEQAVLGQVFLLYYDVLGLIKRQNRYYRDLVLYNLLHLIKRLNLLSSSTTTTKTTSFISSQFSSIDNDNDDGRRRRRMLDEDEDEVTIIDVNRKKKKNSTSTSKTIQHNYFFEIAFICLPYLYSNEVVVVDIMDFLVLKHGVKYESLFHQIQPFWEQALEKRRRRRNRMLVINGAQQKQQQELEIEEEDILSKISIGNIESKISLINSKIHEMSSKMNFFEKLERIVENFETKTFSSSTAILKYLLNEIILLLQNHPKERLFMIMNSKSRRIGSIPSEDSVFNRNMNRIFEGTKFGDFQYEDDKKKKKKKNEEEKMKDEDEEDSIMLKSSPKKSINLANRLFNVCCRLLDCSDHEINDLAMSCLGGLGLLDSHAVDLKIFGGDEENDEVEKKKKENGGDSNNNKGRIKIDLLPEVNKLNCHNTIFVQFLIQIVAGDTRDFSITQKYVIQKLMRHLVWENIQSLPDHIQLLYRGTVDFESNIIIDHSNVYREKRVFYEARMPVKQWVHCFLNHLFQQIDKSQVKDHLREAVLGVMHSICGNLEDGTQVGSFVLPHMIKFVLGSNMKTIKDWKKMEEKKKKIMMNKKKKKMMMMNDEGEEEVEGEGEEDEKKEEEETKSYRVVLDEIETVMRHFLNSEDGYNEAYDHCEEIFKLLDTLFEWSIHMYQMFRFNKKKYDVKKLIKEQKIESLVDKIRYDVIYDYIFGQIDYHLLYRVAYQLGHFERAMLYFETYLLRKNDVIITMTNLNLRPFWVKSYHPNPRSSKNKILQRNEGCIDYDKKLRSMFRNTNLDELMAGFCYSQTLLNLEEFTFLQTLFRELDEICSQIQLSGLTCHFSPSNTTVMQKLIEAEGTGRLSKCLSLVDELLNISTQRNVHRQNRNHIDQLQEEEEEELFPSVAQLGLRRLKYLLLAGNHLAAYTGSTLMLYSQRFNNNGILDPVYRLFGVKSAWRLSKWNNVDLLLKDGTKVEFESDAAGLMCLIPSIQRLINNNNNNRGEEEEEFNEKLRVSRRNILQSLRWSLTKSYEKSIPLLGKLQIISEIEWIRKTLIQSRKNQNARMIDEDDEVKKASHPLLQYDLSEVLQASYDALPQAVDRETREWMLSFRRVLYQSIPDCSERMHEIELSFFRLWKREDDYKSALKSLSNYQVHYNSVRMQDEDAEEGEKDESPRFLDNNNFQYQEYRYKYEKARLLWDNTKRALAMAEIGELLDRLGEQPKGKLERQILMESKFLELCWKEEMRSVSFSGLVEEYESFEDKKVRKLRYTKFPVQWLTKYNEKFYHRLGKCRDAMLQHAIEAFEKDSETGILEDDEDIQHRRKYKKKKKSKMPSPSRRRTRSSTGVQKEEEVEENDMEMDKQLALKKAYDENIFLILKYYLTSLQYGASGDISYFSMSRFLFLYFQYGDLVLTRFRNMPQSSSQFDIGVFHREVRKLLGKIPPSKFFVSQTHILTRILHGEKHVSSTIYSLIEMMVKHNPSFMFWGMMSMAREPHNHKKSDRRTGKSKYKERVTRRIAKMKEILDKLRQNLKSDVVRVYNDALTIFSTLQKVAYHRFKILNLRPDKLKKEFSGIFKQMKRHSKMILPTVQNYDKSFFLADYARDYFQNNNEDDEDEDDIRSSSDDLGVEYVSGGHFQLLMKSKACPKQIDLISDSGRHIMFLMKPSDDGRKDARLMDMFRLINLFFQKHNYDSRSDNNSGKHKYGSSSVVTPIRRFGVTIIEDDCTLVEWVTNTSTLIGCIQPEFQIQYHESGNIKLMDILGDLLSVHHADYNAGRDPRKNCMVYRMMKERTSPYYLRTFYLRKYGHDPTLWFNCRRDFTKSVAVTSIVGYIIGLGDRHLENILVDMKNGRVVHIDFDCTFEQGRKLRTPEIVPFRLTRNIVQTMGCLGVEGLFRHVSEATIHILRKNRETLLTCLSPFLHDPLFDFMTLVGEDLRKMFVESTVSEKEVVMKSMNRIDRKLRGFYDPCASIGREGMQLELGTSPVSDAGIIESLIQESSCENSLGKMYPPWNAFI